MASHHELKGKHGSKISLRGLFHSSSSSLHKEGNESIDNTQSTVESPPIQSHRSFLRQRDSRGATISPQSSSSSLSSFMRKNRKGDNHSGQDIFLSKENSYDPQNQAGGDSSTSLEERNKNTDTISNYAWSEVSELQSSASFEDSKKDQQILSPKVHEKKNNGSRPDSRKQERHGSHLSLKRFLKKFKHVDTEEKIAKSKPSIFSHSNRGNSEIMEKYGPIGKFLGSGATGSVSLVKDKKDETKIYAVKKFRPRFKTETESGYKTKVKNEFEVGYKLKNENIVHTIELIKENSKIMKDTEYYIIMEYCPFDFFNLVMSGLMDNFEKFCYFKQIINGVAHLHSHGLAHRDLKLDNCVVNANGILKLIDFGSAVYFKKEKTLPQSTEDDIDDNYRLVRSRGIVGSDPYLSPEVFEPSNFGYDPRTADVWSIAIIFCCMILRRFPWKIPKVSDPSYKSFLGNPEVKNPDTEDLYNNVKDLKLDENPVSSESTNSAKGSKKLLRLLPSESHNLISQMLTLDPSKRFLIDNVLKDEFFLSIESCHHDSSTSSHNGQATNHIHHLVTEEELKEIQMKNERDKKLKESGVA